MWDGAVYGPEKHRVRVSPYSYRRRRFGDYKGFGTGGRSVQREVNSIVRDMYMQGLNLRKIYFIYAMIAMRCNMRY